MTFEEFVSEEELKEKQRQTERRERETRLEAEQRRRAAVAQKSTETQKRRAAQRAELGRIMDEATKRYAEDKNKVYDLPQPPMAPVPWLVFDRVTGELLGEATTLRAYQAWAEVSPAQSFNACRCVQREDWEAAEEKFRKKKMNGKQRGS